MTTHTFVSYALLVGFFPEYDTREVTFRDVNLAKTNMPERAYSFHFFDLTTTVVDGEELKGNAKNHSGTYYPGGKFWTTEQLKEARKDQTLISNCENNGGQVVECRFGNWQLFSENDQIVGEPIRKKSPLRWAFIFPGLLRASQGRHRKFSYDL